MDSWKRNRVFAVCVCEGGGTMCPPPLVFGAPKNLVGIGLTEHYRAPQITSQCHNLAALLKAMRPTAFEGAESTMVTYSMR